MIESYQSPEYFFVFVINPNSFRKFKSQARSHRITLGSFCLCWKSCCLFFFFLTWVFFFGFHRCSIHFEQVFFANHQATVAFCWKDFLRSFGLVRAARRQWHHGVPFKKISVFGKVNTSEFKNFGEMQAESFFGKTS